MVLQLAKEPSARLLKHVVRCYLRLSDNPRLVDTFILFRVILLSIAMPYFTKYH